MATAGSINYSFSGKNERAQKKARVYAGKRITNINESLRRDIRSVIESSIRDGVDARDAARTIRGILRPAGSTGTTGLTAPMAKAAQNYRETLQASGLSPERIDKLTDDYVAKKLRQRAMTISRTETMDALNEGKVQGWQKAIIEGWLDEDTLVVWQAGIDERTCSVCGSLDGKKVRLGKPGAGKTAGPNFSGRVGEEGGPQGEALRKKAGPGIRGYDAYRPPAHVNCRCTLGIAAKYRAGDVTSVWEPEDVGRIAAEAAPGEGSHLEGWWDKIDEDRRADFTHRVLDGYAPDVAKALGVTLLRNEQTVGGWEQWVNPNNTFQVMGSKGEAAKFAQGMAYAFGQTEVWVQRRTGRIDEANAYGMDIKAGKLRPGGKGTYNFRDADEVARFWKESGLSKVPGLGFSRIFDFDGDPRIRIIFDRGLKLTDFDKAKSSADIDGLIAAARKAMEDSGVNASFKVTPLDVYRAVNDWKEYPDGQRHLRGFGPQEAKDLRGISRRVAESYRRAADGGVFEHFEFEGLGKEKGEEIGHGIFVNTKTGALTVGATSSRENPDGSIKITRNRPATFADVEDTMVTAAAYSERILRARGLGPLIEGMPLRILPLYERAWGTDDGVKGVLDWPSPEYPDGAVSLFAESRGWRTGARLAGVAPEGYYTDSRAVGIVNHETGHYLHWKKVWGQAKDLDDGRTRSIKRSISTEKSRDEALKKYRESAAKDFMMAPLSSSYQLGVAKRVSEYAETNRAEFVAEVFAGVAAGKTYDNNVLGLYEDFDGPELPFEPEQLKLDIPEPPPVVEQNRTEWEANLSAAEQAAFKVWGNAGVNEGPESYRDPNGLNYQNLKEHTAEGGQSKGARALIKALERAPSIAKELSAGISRGRSIPIYRAGFLSDVLEPGTSIIAGTEEGAVVEIPTVASWTIDNGIAVDLVSQEFESDSGLDVIYVVLAETLGSATSTKFVDVSPLSHPDNQWMQEVVSTPGSRFRIAMRKLGDDGHLYVFLEPL